MRKISFLVVLVALLSAGVTHAQQTYSFVRIQVPFEGADQTIASGIHNLGWVVGNWHDSRGPHGFVLRFGKFTSFDVRFPGAQDTVGLGINQRGHVVGTYTAAKVSGFLFKDGEFTSLDVPFPNVTTTLPQGIHVLGQVVGTYYDDVGAHGFVYSQGAFTRVDAPFPGAKDTVCLGCPKASTTSGGSWAHPSF